MSPRTAICCRVLFILPLLVCAFRNANAQTTQSTTSLRGTITDPQRAFVIGATVTLNGSNVGLSREVTTDQAGEYTFLQVVPGTYTMNVKKAGFATAARATVVLPVNMSVRLDLQLALGSVDETIRVEGRAPVINRGAHPNTVDWKNRAKQSARKKCHAGAMSS